MAPRLHGRLSRWPLISVRIHRLPRPWDEGEERQRERLGHIQTMASVPRGRLPPFYWMPTIHQYKQGHLLAPFYQVGFRTIFFIGLHSWWLQHYQCPRSGYESRNNGIWLPGWWLPHLESPYSWLNTEVSCPNRPWTCKFIKVDDNISRPSAACTSSP